MSRAVSAAVLVLLSVPIYAQRGGMHGYAGGRVAIGHVAPRNGGFAAAPQMRPQFIAPRPSGMVRPRGTFLPQRRGTITFGHINGGPFITTSGFNRHFNHHFHHRVIVYALPYYYGAYWPYFGDYWNPYSSSGSYSYDSGNENNNYADLSGQVNQLDAQLNELRAENDSLRSTLQEQSRAAAPVASSSSASSEPATVLVFRDGHHTEVQNYAIVGSTVWLLSSNSAKKVPLSDLDLEQTLKANQERGLTFSVPKSANR